MTTHTYDHELVIGATTDRFKLIRDDTGAAMYQVSEEISQYNPELKFAQNNWIGGHGQYDVLVPDKYFEGQSIDTTVDGKVILGPLITEVKEDDDTALDSAPVCFAWFSTTSELLCATAGKIYRYVKDDTGIDTDEALDTSETGVDCDASATTAIPVGSIIHIESEQMFVSATGTSLTVVREYRGTTAATHVTNTDIYISKWKAATTTLTGVTKLEEFNGVMYASRGASTTYYTSADGDTWTATDLTDDDMVGFLSAPNAAGTANILWGWAANKIYYTTNGAAGGSQWDSGATIGDSSENITNVFLISDLLMVGRPDNLYWYDPDGGVHPLMEDLKHNRSTNNFKYVTHFQSSTYFSLGDGLGEIGSASFSSASFDKMGPLTKIDDIGKKGTCVGLASDSDWIYAVMDEGTNSHIYKGREVRDNNGNLRWEWCPWVYLGTNACATAKVCHHSATDRRLWFGYGTNTAYVLLSDNPLADSDARFAASGHVRMSYTYGSNPYWDKLFQSIVTETAACTANLTVQPMYRKDTEATATNLTAAITTNGVAKTNLTVALTCKRMCFELHLATNSSATSPEVLLFIARGAEKPERVRIHECIYSVGDEPSNRSKTLRDLFRTGRTTTTLIKFADLRYGEKTGGTAGTDYQYCVMEPGYPQEIEIIHEKQRQPELGIKVRLREVNFS